MKQIASREFQLNAAKYLAELPFAITSYGKIIAVVTKPEDQDGESVLSITRDNHVALQEIIAYIRTRKNVTTDVTTKDTTHVTTPAKGLLSREEEKHIASPYHCDAYKCKRQPVTSYSVRVKDAVGNMERVLTKLCQPCYLAAKASKEIEFL